MRQLSRFEDEGSARTLADALYVEGIEGRVDADRDGGFVIWVEDERHMERASELLALFESSPDDARFVTARKKASGQRRAADKESEEARKRAEKARKRFERASSTGYGRVTLGLIAGCAGLAFAMLFTDYDAIYRYLSYPSLTPVGGGRYNVTLDGLRSGEVWRLFTPTFVHAKMIGGGLTGPLHLFFNMYWLKDLGSLMERNKSGLFLFVFVMVVGGIANTFAFFVWDELLFVGFSGVILGLYSYAFVRAKLGHEHQWETPPSFGLWLIGFYLISLFGLFGGVANGVHTGGLLAGGAWGLLAVLRTKVRRS